LTDLTEVISGNKREEEDTQTQLGGLDDVATEFQASMEQCKITETEVIPKILDYTGNTTLIWDSAASFGLWGTGLWGTSPSSLITTYSTIKIRDTGYTYLFSDDFESGMSNFPALTGFVQLTQSTTQHRSGSNSAKTVIGTIPTIDVHGVSMPNSASNIANFGRGFKIHVNVNCTLTTVTKHGSCGAISAKLYDSSHTLLDTQSFVGNDATFSYALTSGSDYFILGFNSVLYATQYSNIVFFPINKTNINYIKYATFDGGSTWYEDAVGVCADLVSITTSVVAPPASIYDYGSLKNGIVRGYFYDTTSETSGMAGMCVDEKIVDDVNKVWLGIYNPTSITKYCYSDGSTFLESSIYRSTGWHRFEFDYSSGTNVVLRIDGNNVYTGSSLTTQFRAIKIGNWTGTAITAYFDDIMMVST
jgi:hypothetical protein